MVSFFQQAAQRISGSLEGVVHELIERYDWLILVLSCTSLDSPRFYSSYLRRHDERISNMKKQRRPGQSSYQEDLLKLQISNEDRLYKETGFCKFGLKA